MLKDTYKELEKQYSEADKYVSEIVDDGIEAAKNYISEMGDDISNYLNDLFDENKIPSLDSDKPDMVLVQLEKLHSSLTLLEQNNNNEYENLLIYVATSLGHLNEKITKILCDHYNVILHETNSQAKKINLLKDYLSKTIINDLYFINSFRNSILHHNDYGHDLSSLDIVTKNKLLSEAKTGIAKLEFVYSELKNIKNSDTQK